MAVGFSKLGIGLTTVFLFLFLALAAELFYVLWWRRRLRRENSSGGSDTAGDPYVSPSKELLYFLCWKNQSRIEPAGAAGAAPALHPTGTELASVPESDGVYGKIRDAAERGDASAWMRMYGPSRVLYTIKEEREESVSAATDDLERGARETTPFSTPCESPFYTPLSSPRREPNKSAGNLNG